MLQIIRKAITLFDTLIKLRLLQELKKLNPLEKTVSIARNK